MIIGGMTREELEANAKGFIDNINAQRVPGLGVVVAFFMRSDLTPFTAANVTPHEAQIVIAKMAKQAAQTIVEPDGKLVV